MSSPTNEKQQYSFPAFRPDTPNQSSLERQSTDEDGTLRDGTTDSDGIDHNRLRVTTSYADGQDHISRADNEGWAKSPSARREKSRRLEDELEVLRAERMVTSAERSQKESMLRSRSTALSRSRTAREPVDDFDEGTTPAHEKARSYKPLENPTTKFAKFFKGVHDSSFLVRYFVYITPLAALFLIPVLLGLLPFKGRSVGGVDLFWFGIWLEIVWLTLWAARIIAKCIPWPVGLIASLFTNNNKKWRDLGKALEVPATLFFWGLALQISFYPTMKNHHVDGDKSTRPWEQVVNKIIITLFVGFILNFIEKIIIQLIAISFHLRTYAVRIDTNKFEIQSLVKLYIYSKDKIQMEDSEFEEQPTGPSPGARTPKAYVEKAQKNVRYAFNRVGDVAGKVAGDFTGKQVATSEHPHQVVLQLLHDADMSKSLARRLYRTFAHEDSERVYADDLKPAFEDEEESMAAFNMFDKDLNGDISMDELESVCVEIGRERKAITASLKDLDSVVSKLNSVFVFIVVVITALVFISLISASASGVLTSAGSTLLACAWLFSVTAQEFLQSCIFVFIKHPFDLGDRVTIYGNTGSTLKGDDYFVKKISLLYTEFKKMEGHVVQAPNSYLNTLFILNQRRSGGLAEAVPVTVKFGTTLEQIDTLRARLLEFVTAENREYQKNILTELTTVYEVHSITLNIVFFYKSNWQNELLRLQRRNKFICALMVTMNELGIEGPRMRESGAAEQFPVYLQNAYDQRRSTPSNDVPPPNDPRASSIDNVPSGSHQAHVHSPLNRDPSILNHRTVSVSQRRRNESMSQMSRRVDFSLGISAISSGADFGNVYDEPKPRVPHISARSPSPAQARTSSTRHRRSNEKESMHRIFSASGSRDGHQLYHTVSSTSGSARATSHRKGFFTGMTRGRAAIGNADPDETTGSVTESVNLRDLEAGTRPKPSFNATEMPDIPEASGANSPSGRRRGGNGSEGEMESEMSSPRLASTSSRSEVSRRWRTGTGTGTGTGGTTAGDMSGFSGPSGVGSSGAGVGEVGKGVERREDTMGSAQLASVTTHHRERERQEAQERAKESEKEAATVRTTTV